MEDISETAAQTLLVIPSVVLFLVLNEKYINIFSVSNEFTTLTVLV